MRKRKFREVKSGSHLFSGRARIWRYVHLILESMLPTMIRAQSQWFLNFEMHQNLLGGLVKIQIAYLPCSIEFVSISLKGI